MNLNVKKEVLENLKNANDYLIESKSFVKLVIVGGAPLILRNIINRSTTDIDYINKVSNEMQIILDEFEINNRVVTFEQTYGDWKEDIIPMSSELYSNIELFTISIERQAASRLFSRRRFEDVIEITKQKYFNFRCFENIVNEIYGYTVPVYVNEFMENKTSVIKLYKERGWDYETSNIKKLYNK